MTQTQRIRAMRTGERNVDLYNNGRDNARAALQILIDDHAGRLAMLTVLDEIEHEDVCEALDKAGM